MIDPLNIPFAVVRNFVIVIALTGSVAVHAQGTASQPALDNGRPDIDAPSESQKPADATEIHEGAGPIDCEAVLARENNAGGETQPGVLGSAAGSSGANAEPGSGPYREDQPEQDTQISTIEECRARQHADSSHDSAGDAAD